MKKTDYAAGNKSDYIREFYEQYPDGIVPEFYCVIASEDPLLFKIVRRGDEGFEAAKERMRQCKAMEVVNKRLCVSFNQDGMEKAKRLKFNKPK